MAATNSVEYAKITGASSTYNPLAPHELEGRVRCAFFHGQTAAQAAADTINLTKLPAGARVLGIMFACDDMSAGSATLDIGDADDDDRFISALDVSSAVGYDWLTIRTPDNLHASQTVGFGYRYTTATDIVALVNTAALNTGADYHGCILYVVD